MAAYGPTNTVILTESASNIRRLIAILESIDVEIYKEELAVIRVEFADAAIMASQISEIFGAEVSSATTLALSPDEWAGQLLQHYAQAVGEAPPMQPPLAQSA